MNTCSQILIVYCTREGVLRGTFSPFDPTTLSLSFAHVPALTLLIILITVTEHNQELQADRTDAAEADKLRVQVQSYLGI